MKFKYIIIALIILILAAPFAIGMLMPKDKIVTEKAFIDKMYFFILADITNHWEEPTWRHNLDTMIQIEQIDGMDAWVEHYTNGDSILLMTQITAETDYIRIIVDKDGQQRGRSIMLVDVQGKTAIRMSEEVYMKSPLKRFMSLFVDKETDILRAYLDDLAEKNRPKEGNDSMDGNW